MQQVMGKALTTAIFFLAAAVLSPLQVVTAQRDQAIAQRNAWRDKANAMIRVCRQHGMTGEDPVEWLGEVLADGSERWQWNEAMERARGASEE